MEPKYKLYDVVTIPLENGERRNAMINYVYPDVEGVPLYSIMPERESDDEYMFHEDDLQPVKTIPITEPVEYVKMAVTMNEEIELDGKVISGCFPIPDWMATMLYEYYQWYETQPDETFGTDWILEPTITRVE